MFAVLVCALLAASLGTESQQDAADSDQSLARIRKGLAVQTLQIQSPAPEPTFRVSVQQTPLVNESLLRSDAKDGPIPPGGLYAFEQRQRLGNPWVNQPFIQIDLLPLADAIRQAIGDHHRLRMEHRAHDDVIRALTEFCVTNVCQPVDR